MIETPFFNGTFTLINGLNSLDDSSYHFDEGMFIV